MGEKQATGRTIEAGATVTLLKQQTQSGDHVGARNGTLTHDQEPATSQQNGFYQQMQAIGKGETLNSGKGSEQLNEPPVVTDFRPWPEEYQ